MTGDQIQYEELAQEALRGVIRKVLQQAEKDGLPGEHHFYIAFDTGAPDVEISSRLKEQYPEEMTVVLQHQFWDLKVTDTYFQIKLSFNNTLETLIVPFEAIKVFFDPSVPYGLQFGNAAEVSDQDAHPVLAMPELIADTDDPSTVLPPSHASSSSPPPFGASGNSKLSDATAKTAEPVEKDEEKPEPPEAETSNDDNPSANVVELDAFRKK